MPVAVLAAVGVGVVPLTLGVARIFTAFTLATAPMLTVVVAAREMMAFRDAEHVPIAVPPGWIKYWPDA